MAFEYPLKFLLHEILSDLEDVRHWLESEEDAEEAEVAGTTVSADSDGGTLPDDNISQYGADEDSQENI